MVTPLSSMSPPVAVFGFRASENEGAGVTLTKVARTPQIYEFEVCEKLVAEAG